MFCFYLIYSISLYAQQSLAIPVGENYSVFPSWTLLLSTKFAIYTPTLLVEPFFHLLIVFVLEKDCAWIK